MRSDLAVLVETEARLDREVADARAKAAALEEQTRGRVQAAEAELAVQLERERIRIAAEVERDTSARIAEIEQTAVRDVQRFAAIRDKPAELIARRIAAQLIAIVTEEDVA
ncbi:MAG TPA: hypothetical protein VIV40_23845 [Kofleriaceae bacterium]